MGGNNALVQQSVTIAAPQSASALVQDFGHAQLLNLDDPATHNYLLSDYAVQPTAGAVALVAQHQHQDHQQEHHQQQPQHIITKDGLVYEQLDYSYPSAAVPVESNHTDVTASDGSVISSVPIKLEHQQHSYGSLVVDQQQQQHIQQLQQQHLDHNQQTPPQQHFKKKIQARSTPQSASAIAAIPSSSAATPSTSAGAADNSTLHQYKPPSAQPPDQILQSPPATPVSRGRGGARNRAVADVQVTPPPTAAHVLAMIATADDLEDLSHLDEPVVVPMQPAAGMRPRQPGYIQSYCSFLQSRTHTK